jgi:GxxExxY protein
MKREEIDLITEEIIGCAFRVSNELGIGFLEKVYENAMFIELKDAGLQVERQKALTAYYRGSTVGEYYADLFVNGEVVVELKAAKSIDDSHIAQLLNYLRICKKQCGLVLNFGKTESRDQTSRE